MSKRACRALSILLVAEGCASASAPPLYDRPPSSSPPKEMIPGEAEHERYLGEVRSAVAPALGAFEARRSAELLAWIEDPQTRPAYKVYGAFLLQRLGIEDAKRLFVEHFPTRDRDEFGLFWDLEQALAESDAPYMHAQGHLICGAIRGWHGASEKLLEVRAITDASTHTDNCCGLVALAVARPDATLELVSGRGEGDELMHAFEEEASPGMANELLTYLTGVTYAEPEREKLRKALYRFFRRRPRRVDPSARATGSSAHRRSASA